MPVLLKRDQSNRPDIPQPRAGNKHTLDISHYLIVPLILLTILLLFVLWRRASKLRSVVQHRLRTFSSNEGAIHLPEDGPPAELFNEDEELDEQETIIQANVAQPGHVIPEPMQGS